MERIAVFAIALLAGGNSWAAEEGGPESGEKLFAFLDKYCLECHDDIVQKGERRFDLLHFPITDAGELIEVQDIIDQLNLGEMPPRKAKRHPSSEERAEAIGGFTEAVAEVRESLASTGGQTVLRRLNRREYLNTLEDLLGRDLTSFDPTTQFPRDRMVEHMDNIGDTLVTSGYLLDQYLDAADAVVEKALEPTGKPEVRSWHFTENFKQGQELSYSHGKVYQYRYLCVYEVPNTVNHEGGYAAIEDFQEGVHADGIYEVQVLAHSMHRDTPYDPAIFRMDFSQPFRLGVVPGEKAMGTLHHPQPIEPQLAEVTVRDGKPQWYTMRVWLEKNQTPRFIFPNGMANCRQAFGRIARDYKDQWPKKDPYTGGIVEARRIVLQHGKMPHIRIHEVKVKGPFYESWPPESQRLLFGEGGFSEVRTREILANFADRAYRRPVTDEEVERLLAVVQARKEQGRSPREAVKDGIKAALVSPSFLYLAEPSEAEEEPALDAHDLASRLSYFLWSTMPDSELRELADDRTLLEPKVLRGQLDRMLKDERSDEFIAGFLDSWLNLRSLGDMPPDRSAFVDYYAKDFPVAMKEETRLFTRHLIEKNGPITDYLDSDYTFANAALARHYRLDVEFPPEKAHEFRRVSFAGQPARGGLLGMGSVLTVTANGIETSPVIRGVWLLENILGTPPPPPPDDVPPIDPDIRGATSIRDQLTKHREQETCFDCHQKIDPPGFALENFDPIGGWRTHYPAGKKQGPKIDASGEFSNGDTFAGVTEFRKRLLDRKDLFARMLTERLLTYATGRRIEVLDRPEVDRITEAVSEDEYGMRTLLEEVVMSSVFRSR